MAKAAVIYWSGTGNTEAMAELVAQGVRSAGGTADIIKAGDFAAEKVGDYDAFALGCPAMGDEELEESEFEPMYEEIEPLIKGKKVVLFGSYDWNEGEWMEKWEERAEIAGLDVVDSAIAKDYPDEDATDDCLRIGSALVE